MAWKKIVGGTWQFPLELAKAEILQYEFNAYRRKYQESGVLSHEAKALESDVNSLLGGWCDLTGKITGGVKVDNLREWEVSRDSEVAVYSSTKTSLGIRLEDNGYEERFNRSEYPTFDCSFAASSFGHKGSERVDYEFPEIEGRDKLLNVDLSHIPEEQRYLKVTPSDNDDSTTLETINGKEYFVKLKELELNEFGEFVMTLKPSTNRCFIGLPKDIEENYLSVKNKLQDIESQVELNLNDTDNLQNMIVSNCAVKIDSIIGNIFKNIRIQDE